MASELSKILCVEDEADIQAVAKVALETVGQFQVQMCSSGQEALDTLPEFAPQLILLDVMMPGMDGPTTYQEIRKIDGYAEVPIIFMTAKVMESDRDQYISLGAAGIIAKPFDPMVLSDQIRQIWNEHHDG
jgi:two-component system, OmpR family, response regulator